MRTTTKRFTVTISNGSTILVREHRRTVENVQKLVLRELRKYGNHIQNELVVIEDHRGAVTLTSTHRVREMLAFQAA